MGSFLNPASFVYPRNGGVFGGSSAAPVFPLLVATANQSNANNNIATSEDGINWTLRTTPVSTRYEDSAYSPSLNRIVAVTQGGIISRSDNRGVNWSNVSFGGGGAGYHRSIAWSPTLNLFCAVGGNAGTVALATSPDGITWAARTPAASCTQMSSVMWDSVTARFYAYGNGGFRVMYSDDGIVWVRATGTTGTSDSLNGFIFRAGAYLICVNASDFIPRYSIDGITWTNGPSWSGVGTSGSNGFNSGGRSDGLFFVTSTAGMGIKSNDPSVLVTVCNPPYNNAALGAMSCTYSVELGKFIAIFQTGSTPACGIHASADLITWTLTTPPSPFNTKTWKSVRSFNIPIP